MSTNMFEFRIRMVSTDSDNTAALGALETGSALETSSALKAVAVGINKVILNQTLANETTFSSYWEKKLTDLQVRIMAQWDPPKTSLLIGHCLSKSTGNGIEKNISGNSGQLTKDRKEMFLKINDALGEWMLGALATNCIFTGKILQTKALKFAEKFLKKNNFKTLDNWLEKFKKRHNLHHIKMHDKANSAFLKILPEE
ncbi:hypothetical protein G9A89_007889 [Geosiphon pyriformis]|nr:hypothetical protein G9A89_007889 [Geosiphon pyriformis]